MDQESIFIPFFGMMILTIVVWVYMYYLRLTFMWRHKVDPQSLATTSQVLGVVPENINTPSENLINLFELPVLFYAACIYLYITQKVDGVYLVFAYGFLVLRIGHSVIHCTYNKVTHRFFLYILSSIALWALIIRAFLRVMYA
jgi:hypothetical protein